MKKISNISSAVLAGLFVISAIVLVMFYCVGYGDMEVINGQALVAPKFTSLLLLWQYVLVAVCALVVLGFAVVNGFKNRKNRKNGERRNSFVAPVFTFMTIAIVLSYVFSSGISVRLGDTSLYEDIAMLKLADVCLYTIYVLVVSSLFCSMLSMVGVFKSRK